MKQECLGAICVLVLGLLPTRAATAVVASSWSAQGQEQQATRQSGTPRLEDGTPVKLRISRTISSESAQTDERVDFDVLEEVKVGDLVVIPKGSIAWGSVTEAQAKRRMGRAGKLDINIDAVRLASGDKAALRGVKEVKGGGHTGAMTGAIVATSLVLWPAAPFFLFMHGKDITIPKGTELTVYINGDTPIDPAKFRGGNATNQPASTSGGTTTSGVAPATQSSPVVQAVELSTVVVKSTPDGAEIIVDGKYVGNTPSTVRLAPGDHTFSLEKSGYTSWQRTMTAGSGSIVTVDATLQKVQ